MEIWKDIKGYEGLYQVSNYGNIKSLSNNKTKKEKILLSKTKGSDYNIVTLFKKGNKKRFRVHRIVAEHFLELVEEKNCVNHIDGNKNNNYVNNLEWCNHLENMRHAHATKLFDYSKFSKKVFQYDKDLNFIKEWKSVKSASEELKFCKENISRCCRKGKHCKAYGYIWSYNKII